MEDPWANAWGEPSKSPSSNWSAPSVSTIHGDNEDDISTRSWSVEPTTRWDEANLTEASLWRNEPSSTWQPAYSTFDTIPLSIPAQPPRLTSEEPLSSSDNSPPSSPISETPSLSLSLSPNKPLHLSRPATPDAFGTFKGADEFEEPTDESWKPTLSLSSADADTWRPSWGESNLVEPPGTAEALDIAWETAKQQKERQDRHVPPELLASILRQLEEMSGELWPDTDASISATENEKSLEVEIVVPASIAQKFMPDDMTLPSNVPFTNTFISKQLTEALKLTKHAPQTRLSPMAMYMSSKGSTSWEASIKSQPNITHEDFAPAGWKIVEAAKESTVVDDSKKKAGSGLFSFFGRRTTSQSDTTLHSNSPPIISPVISSKTGTSPRASTDNIRSTPTIRSSQDTERTTPALPIATSSSSSISIQKNDSNPTTSIVASDSIVREATPPPSAVSRFLGRFSSRARPRESLALSQDDLEFLSDVPTFSESESNRDSELDALSKMIKSSPLTTTLPSSLPPPLPPPPPASQPTRTLSQTTKLEKDPMNDDLFSIFNSSYSASNRIHTPMKPSTPSVTGSLLNSPVSPTAPPLADSRNSGSIISNQGWSFGDLPAPANEIVAVMTPPNNCSTPPPVSKPKRNAAFPILSQGSSSQKQWQGRDSLASELAGVISPLSPPPRSRSHAPSHTALSPPVINLDDDDDFSGFLSSPAQSAPPVPPSFTHDALVTNPSSSIGQTPTTTNNIFDGFDEFLGPFSSDPQPPLPPAKQTAQPFVPASNFPPSNNRQHSRTVSKADHCRTLSLLENVAAHGRWLGPASPLPEALSPPASSNMKSSSSNDYINPGSSMQAQQAQVMAALPKHSQNGSHQLTPTYLFPPPVSSQPPLLKPHTSSINPVVTPTKVKSGSLSAQDLSFFEGL